MARRNPQLKTVPAELSFEALFEPGDRWSYLEHAAGNPRAVSPRFEAVNAWWLIELSMLAYAREETIRAVLGEAGFGEVSILERENTLCLVADDLVAFRGTAGSSDLWRDLDALLVPEGAGDVHRGFQRALDHVWADLRERIADRAVTFTGHSLGAALATIAASRHEAARAVYTFGSPRVGDVAFCRAVRPPVYRVVNNTDLVPLLPPPLRYAHVGEFLHLDARGELRRGPGPLEQLREGLAGHLAQLQTNFQRWRAGEFEVIPLAPLVDHSPIHYAVHLWNHLVSVAKNGADPISGKTGS